MSAMPWHRSWSALSRLSTPRACLSCYAVTPQPSRIAVCSTTLFRASRSFHASPRSHVDTHNVVDMICTAPHEMLVALHDTGISWAVAFPLAAVIIRTFVVFPLISLPVRRSQQRAFNFQPVKQAHLAIVKRRVIEQYGHMDKAEYKKALNLQMGTETRLLNGRWRIRSIFFNLWQFPIFLAMAETVRRMCGANSSLLGLIAEFIQPKAKALADKDRGEVIEAVSKSWFEPSIAQEGALWFQDLSVADPTLTLPFLVSGATMLNIWMGFRLSKATQDEMKMRNQPVRKTQKEFLRNITMSMAFLIGPMTMNMPAAILVYWLSSTVCSIAAHSLIDRFWPLRIPPLACKRPLRL